MPTEVVHSQDVCQLHGHVTAHRCHAQQRPGCFSAADLRMPLGELLAECCLLQVTHATLPRGNMHACGHRSTGPAAAWLGTATSMKQHPGLLPLHALPSQHALQYSVVLVSQADVQVSQTDVRVSQVDVRAGQADVGVTTWVVLRQKHSSAASGHRARTGAT